MCVVLADSRLECEDSVRQEDSAVAKSEVGCASGEAGRKVGSMLRVLELLAVGDGEEQGAQGRDERPCARYRIRIRKAWREEMERW